MKNTLEILEIKKEPISVINREPNITNEQVAMVWTTWACVWTITLIIDKITDDVTLRNSRTSSCCPIGSANSCVSCEVVNGACLIDHVDICG